MSSFQPNQLTQAFQPFDPELPDPLACSRQGGVAAAFFLAMAFALRSAFCLYFEAFDRAFPVLCAAPKTGNQYPASVSLCSMPVSVSTNAGLLVVVG